LPKGTDLVFLALHGTYGEDGTVQQRLEKLERLMNEKNGLGRVVGEEGQVALAGRCVGHRVAQVRTGPGSVVLAGSVCGHTAG
jgi:hypothetical protein